MPPVHISGYDVYVARNSYVNRRMLDLPSMRESVEGKIGYVVQNTGGFGLRLHGELSAFNRVHLQDNMRLYLRVHKNRGVVVIVGFDTASDLKRDENVGALNLDFIKALKRFEEFDWGWMEPLLPLAEKAEEAVVEEEVDTSRYLPRVEAEDTTEEMAAEFLMGKQAPKASGLFLWILRRIDNGEVRIILDPAHEEMPRDLEGMRKWRMALASFLRESGAGYVARIDGISGKIVVVPAAKLDVYCFGMRGRRPKTVSVT